MRVARLSRRHLLSGLLGTLTAAAGPSLPAGAEAEGPPPFESARHQFTILRPAKAFPAVRLTRPDGTVNSLAQFSGKVMLVNFWATWCAACKLELPMLDRLQGTLGKNFQVVAISLDRGGRATVLPFLHQFNLRHVAIFLDPDGKVAGKGHDDGDEIPFPLYGMPMSYVIGASGFVEGYIAGEADWSSDSARKLLDYYARAD